MIDLKIEDMLSMSITDKEYELEYDGNKSKLDKRTFVKLLDYCKENEFIDDLNALDIRVANPILVIKNVSLLIICMILKNIVKMIF